MTDTVEETEVLRHNLMVTALALVGEIFEDYVDGADDVYWDLTPIMMVDPGPNGPQPSSRYLFLVYTKALVPPDGSSTISAFDMIVSPMILLDGPKMRELVVNGVTFVREQRRKQIAITSPQ